MFNRILLSIVLVIMFVAKVFACEVSFETIAEKYDLRDELFDDYLGLYWPGFKSTFGFDTDIPRGSRIEINGIVYELIHSIESYDGYKKAYVRLLRDGEKLVVQKSVNMTGHQGSYLLLEYLASSKIQKRFQLQTPSILEYGVDANNESKSILVEFIPGGTLIDFMDLYREGILNKNQFDEGIRKLRRVLKGGRKLASKSFYKKWALENQIIFEIDLLHPRDLKSVMKSAIEYDSSMLSRQAQNVRYFRGQWYVVDP